MKRPPSLSESAIYTGNYVSMNDGPLVPYSQDKVKDIEAVKGAEAAESAVAAVASMYWDCEKACEYSLRFTFHITLISIFETIFFFLFISKDEDSGILGTTSHYTDALIDRCAALPRNDTDLLNSILVKLINASSIISKGDISANRRINYNNQLYQLSWTYVIILFACMTSIATFSKWKKYKISWSYIIIENIILVSMLGLYEYMFFETVIKNYLAETPEEISELFIKSLQTRCHILI